MSRKIIGVTVGTPLNPEMIFENTEQATPIVNVASGEVVATTDSAKAKPKNIRLYGKTEQDSTEGNQLFDLFAVTSGALSTDQTINGVTFTRQSDGKIILNGTATDTIDLYLLNTGNNSNLSLYEYINSNYQTYTLSNNLGLVNYFYSSATSYVQNNITSSETVIVDIAFIRIPNGTTFANKILEIMLNPGSTALPWEPYTGGEPSPNRNYQQPLNSHGDSGSIENKLLSSNLIKLSLSVGFTTTKNGVTFTILEDGGVSVVGTNTGDEVSLCIVQNKSYFLPIGEYTIHAKGVQQNLIQIGTWGEDFKKFFNNQSVVFQKDMSLTGTFAEPTAPMVSIYVKANATVNTTIYMALNAGKETLPYEPYTEQPFTALTPNGLPGIPLGQTIPDVIKNSPIHMAGVYWDKATSQYYIGDTKDYESGEYVQRIAELNNDKWYLDGKLSTTTGYRFRAYKFGMLSMTWSPIMCTHFRAIKANEMIYSYGSEGTYISTDEGQVDGSICIRTEENTSPFTTTDECIAWMNENDVKTNYVLASPIITDLTQEELDQYNALLMNYPNTTVVNDAGAYMEVEYVADTKCYIDNKFKQLEMALANTNAQLL